MASGMSVAELQVIVRALDQATATLAKVRTELDAMSGGHANAAAAAEKSNAAHRGLGSSIKSLEGNVLGIVDPLATMAAGITAVSVAMGSVKGAMDFKKQMEMVRTQAGASQAEVDKLTGAVLDFAKVSPQGPEELAKALYHIESVGLRGADAMNVLKIASEGSAVGNANLEAVTNTLTAATVAHIKGTENQTDAMGTLNAIVGAGNMRMEDLAASMSSGILPTAQQVGIGLTDVGAALATMTDAGVPAVDAATRLRISFFLMAAETPRAAQALQEIGINQLDLAAKMRNEGLIPALQLLKTRLDEFATDPNVQTEILSKALGGGRTAGTIVTLLDNLDRVKSKFTDISATSNKFGDDFAATQKTAAYQWDTFMSKLKADETELGQKVMPAFIGSLNGINVVMKHMSEAGDKVAAVWAKFSDQDKKFILIAAAAAGLAVVVGVTVVAAFTMMAASATVAAIAANAALLGIPIAIAAVVAAIYLLATHWDQVWAGMKAAPGELARATEAVFDVAMPYVERAWSAALEHMRNQVPTWGQYVDSAFTAVATYLNDTVFPSIENGWQGMMDRLPGEMDGPLGQMESKFAQAAAHVKGFFLDMASAVGDAFSAANKGAMDAAVGDSAPDPDAPTGVGSKVKAKKIAARQRLEAQNQDLYPQLTKQYAEQQTAAKTAANAMAELNAALYGDSGGGYGGGGGGGGGLAGAAGSASATISQAQKDMIALALAFADWHQQTGGDAKAFGEYLDAQKLAGQATQQVTDAARTARVELRALDIVLGAAGITGEAFVAEQGLRALATAFQASKMSADEFINALHGFTAKMIDDAQSLANSSHQPAYAYHQGQYTDSSGVAHSGDGYGSSPRGPAGFDPAHTDVRKVNPGGIFDPGAPIVNPNAPGYQAPPVPPVVNNYHAPVTIVTHGDPAATLRALDMAVN